MPITTLFMLMSLDGKISTGAVDDRDFDQDLPAVPGVGDGLVQYHRLEEESGPWSLNSGRVLAKVGWNESKPEVTRLPVSFVVLDDHHLTEVGVRNLLRRVERLVVATSNPRHPAATVDDPRLLTLPIERPTDFPRLFGRLDDLGVHELTVQSGGTLNATLVRAGLVDQVSVVVAPVLVGGRDTPTLLDGPAAALEQDLALLRPLDLVDVRALEHSYLHLRYAVAPREAS